MKLTPCEIQWEKLRLKQKKNEQWVRRSNVQINGVPHKDGEDLMSIVSKISSYCNYPIKPESDIDFITRVAVKNPKDPKKPKPIIVKFQSRYKKDDLLSAFRKLKVIQASDIGFVGCTDKVYINDHLSAYNKSLLNQARSRAEERKYAFVWVRNCTVHVRRDEKSPVIFITSQDALNKIV